MPSPSLAQSRPLKSFEIAVSAMLKLDAMTERNIIPLDLAVTRDLVQAIKADRMLFCLCIYHYAVRGR